MTAFPAFHAGPKPPGWKGPLALVRDAGVRDTLALLLLVQNRMWDDPAAHTPPQHGGPAHPRAVSFQAASFVVRGASNARTRVLVLEDGSALVEDVVRARMLPVPFRAAPHAVPPTDALLLEAAALWVDHLGGRTIGWSTGCLSPQTMECAPEDLWLDPNHRQHALPKGNPTPFFQAVQGLALAFEKAHTGPPLAHLSLEMGIPASRGGWHTRPRLSVGFFVHRTRHALQPRHADALQLFLEECALRFGPQALCGWRWGHERPLPVANPLKVPVKAWEGHVYHDLCVLEHVPSSAHAEAACLHAFFQTAPRTRAALQ